VDPVGGGFGDDKIDKAKPSPRAPSARIGPPGGPPKSRDALERELKHQHSRAEGCEKVQAAIRQRSQETREKLDAAEEKVEKMEQERLLLRRELEEAKTKASDAARAALEQLRQAKVSEETLSDANAQLKAVADQYNGALATLQKQSSQLQIDRQFYADQVAGLQAANAELQRERDDFNKANASLREQLDALEDALRASDSNDPAFSAVKEAFDRFSEENDKFFAEAEQLQAQAAAVNVEVNVSVEAFDRLQASLDRLEAQNAELKGLVEMLQQQLSASTQEILDSIKEKTLELRQEDMDDLNTIIAMTNPARFNELLRIAVLRQNVAEAVMLIKYGANPYEGAGYAGYKETYSGTNLEGGRTELLPVILTVFLKNPQEEGGNSATKALMLAENNIEAKVAILQAMASKGIELNLYPHLGVMWWFLFRTIVTDGFELDVDAIKVAAELGMITNRNMGLLPSKFPEWKASEDDKITPLVLIVASILEHGVDNSMALDALKKASISIVEAGVTDPLSEKLLEFSIKKKKAVQFGMPYKFVFQDGPGVNRVAPPMMPEKMVIAQELLSKIKDVASVEVA
jgi:cytochrome c556